MSWRLAAVIGRKACRNTIAVMIVGGVAQSLDDASGGSAISCTCTHRSPAAISACRTIFRSLDGRQTRCGRCDPDPSPVPTPWNLGLAHDQSSWRGARTGRSSRGSRREVALRGQWRRSGPVADPGAAADAAAFAGIARWLRDRFTVVAYDPRGTCRSPQGGPPSDITVQVQADAGGRRHDLSRARSAGPEQPDHQPADGRG